MVKIQRLIQLLLILISISFVQTQNITGNFTANQTYNLEYLFSQSTKKYYIGNASEYLMSQLSTIFDETGKLFSVLVYSELNNASPFLDQNFIQDRKYIVRINFGQPKWTFIVWKNTNFYLYSFIQIFQVMNPEEFVRNMSYQELDRIKDLMSKAIIQKGNNMRSNAAFIVSSLKSLNLGVWVVVITQIKIEGLQMTGYIGSNLNKWAFVNYYGYFRWNYFLQRIM